MPKRSHAEHLIAQNPALRQLSEYYESLGLLEPVLWAQGETEGEACVSTAALLHALRNEVLRLDDNGEWLNRVREGDLNVENESLLNRAREAITRLDALGVPADLILPLVRVAQAEAVNNMASLLDQGPRISCLPLPPGREVDWQLVEVDAEGKPRADISGFAMLVRSGSAFKDEPSR